MRKLIILILFVSGAANVSADCTQADLAGWWDYSADNVSCSFLLDEEGSLQKGNCSRYILIYPGLSFERPLGKIGIVYPLLDFYGANVVVDDHCKVKGAFNYCTKNQSCGSLAPRTKVVLMDGRLNLDKSTVSGIAGLWESGTGQEQHAAYTLTKF